MLFTVVPSCTLNLTHSYSHSYRPKKPANDETPVPNRIVFTENSKYFPYSGPIDEFASVEKFVKKAGKRAEEETFTLNYRCVDGKTYTIVDESGWTSCVADVKARRIIESEISIEFDKPSKPAYDFTLSFPSPTQQQQPQPNPFFSQTGTPTRTPTRNANIPSPSPMPFSHGSSDVRRSPSSRARSVSVAAPPSSRARSSRALPRTVSFTLPDDYQSDSDFVDTKPNKKLIYEVFRCCRFCFVAMRLF